jgi:hypothetical protein
MAPRPRSRHGSEVRVPCESAGVSAGETGVGDSPTMSTDTPIELAYARAYALLRAAGASDQATFDIVFSRAHGELVSGYPDQHMLIVQTLLHYARQLGRAAYLVRERSVQPVPLPLPMATPTRPG